MTTLEVNASTAPSDNEPLTQHIVVRGDLEWGNGPMMAQAAHCSVAALETFRDAPETQLYLADLDHMRKVIWKVKNLEWLEKVKIRLKEAGVPFREWIEQPENIPVGLATMPTTRQSVEKVWKGNGVGNWK